ncbi:hypothetical protein ACFX13_006069 [Malus domestica]
MVAKVSDFELSKMGTTNTYKTHISTVVKGSFGYLNLEYYRRQQLIEKSDVYSFGVVLWEVLCARLALMHKVEAREISLIEWAKSCHGDGTLDQIIDPNVKGIERPSMNDVVRGLELALQLHQKSIGRQGDNGVAFVNDCGDDKYSEQCISVTIFSEINNTDER